MQYQELQNKKSNTVHSMQSPQQNWRQRTMPMPPTGRHQLPQLRHHRRSQHGVPELRTPRNKELARLQKREDVPKDETRALKWLASNIDAKPTPSRTASKQKEDPGESQSAEKPSGPKTKARRTPKQNTPSPIKMELMRKRSMTTLKEISKQMTPYIRTNIKNQTIMHELAELYYKQRATGDAPPAEYLGDGLPSSFVLLDP
jgi:hypothetical protein